MAYGDKIRDPMKEFELLSVRIERGDKHRLEEYAEENDITTSQIVRRIIKSWIKVEDAKRAKK